MTFEAIMQVTSHVSSHAAFEDHECQLFHETLQKLPPQSDIVEIGVEYGRSSSIIAQEAVEHGHFVTFIDPFVDPDSLVPFVQLMQRLGLRYTLHAKETRHILKRLLPLPIRLLHIDGSHTREDLTVDCERVLPRVSQGGFVCFHDYGRNSLPDVFPVVNEYMVPDKWEPVAVAGTLGVWRRK